MAPLPSTSEQGTDQRPRPDDRRDTLIVVVSVAVALASIAGWTLARGVMRDLAPLTLAALVGAAFLADRIAVPITTRNRFHASTPVVLLTGLVGGPVAGAVAGGATGVAGLRDAEGWKRSASYGAVAAVQGLLAGIAGLVVVGSVAVSATIGASLAAVAFLATNLLARTLIGRTRQIRRSETRAGSVSDAIEAVVLVPVLAVLAGTYRESGPVLVLAVLAATLFGLWRMVELHRQLLEERATERATDLAEHRRRVQRLERLVARLRHDALTDQLTDVPNRRAYQRELERSIDIARRHGLTAGLLLIDVDHFKEINTAESMTGGDAVLRAVVERVREGLREEDFLARRGGEEFVVIAPGIGDEDTLRYVADKVRGFVAAVALRRDGLERHVTVSIGATLVDGGAGAPALDHAINEAMILAKQTRNTVVTLPAPVAGEPVRA